MLKSRIKRRAIESAQVTARLADIRRSILALNDEDLLDLADIFRGNDAAALGEMAAAELSKRNLSL